MKKILIIQTASIGDVILATPLLEKLHDIYGKEAKIDFLLKEGNQNLFRKHPFLHQILVWDKSQDKYKNLLEIIRFVRDVRYDIVINLQRFASSGLITTFSKAGETIGFSKNPFSLFFSKRIRHRIKKDGSGVMHESERNLSLAAHLSGKKTYPVKLYPDKAAYAKVSQYKTSAYITISPASLWFTKQFPKEKWIEFINKISKDINVYLFGGTKDKELCDEIINSADHSAIMNLAGKLSFLETTALMKDAQMNYTNDSAPLHMASSVNAPVAAIFCSTVPSFGFGPLSERSYIIETDEKLKCRPCGLHGYTKCPEEHFKCASEISTERLLELIV